jgi:glycosyltransferase involved in cell wall biosynthesis
LDTRIKAIRETWIKDLKARNIPYVILVGDGDDTIQGDVLALDVSDTYEDLPLKTLKLFDWVYNNTNAQYVLKIDDDCYLEVDRYFDNLSYRKHHYYGRVIHRPVGGMDRTWHHSKSKTERAQKAIDKSPEPALYADGGGAYTLSRIAMSELSQNAKIIQGKRLIANSFMEDKLVGDLLAMSHIEPSNEDYECYQRRRTFGAATPVGMFENTFFPSINTPTVVTHLDTDKDQLMVESYKNLDALWPKKIWPSCWAAQIRGSSNQLELLTALNSVATLMKNELVVIAAMRNEMVMLPHFLKHYRDLGIKTFIIADNCSDDGTREFLLEQLDVILYSADTEYKHSHYGVAWQQAMLANHCVGKWTLIADADELLVYPNMQTQSLLEFVKSVEKTGADCVRTDMIDMYPFGDLNDADFTKDEPFNVAGWHDKEPLQNWVLGSGFFSNAISSVSALRHRIDVNAEPNAFTSQKYALIKYKPWMRFSQGIHDVSGVNRSEVITQFAHFKYHAGFKAKIVEEIKRKQHYDGAKEYKRYASMLAEASGGFGEKKISTMLDVENNYARY